MSRKVKCTNPETTTYGKYCIGHKCEKHETCPILKKFELDIKNAKELTIAGHVFTLDKNADEAQVKEYFQDILTTADECHTLSTRIKALEEVYATKRHMLEISFKNLDIKNLNEETYSISGFTTSRFKNWTDEKALLNAIPKDLRNLSTLSPDHKKIAALIKKKKLPIALLNFEEKTDPKFTLRFINKEEDYS